MLRDINKRQELQQKVINEISNLIDKKKVEQHFYYKNVNIQRIHDEIHQVKESGIDIMPGEVDRYICEWCFRDFIDRDVYFNHARYCIKGKSWFKKVHSGIDITEDVEFIIYGKYAVTDNHTPTIEEFGESSTEGPPRPDAYTAGQLHSAHLRQQQQQNMQQAISQSLQTNPRHQFPSSSSARIRTQQSSSQQSSSSSSSARIRTRMRDKEEYDIPDANQYELGNLLDHIHNFMPIYDLSMQDKLKNVLQEGI